ncbi:hypothetical protein AB1Y20_009105 [Prymnesium parvum]|uniref:Uncharacterized protein n=1 Tax=Prymnesium parvum TaxID=97485 RepID=A0AB34K145_PRYPA
MLSEICSTHDRQRALALGRTFAWCTLLALRGTPLEDAAARCILSSSAFTGSTDRMANFDSPGASAPFTIGARPATYLAASPLTTTSSNAGAVDALAKLIRDDHSLIDALDARRDDELLSGWREIIRPLDPTDIPDGLLSALPSFDRDLFDSVPLTAGSAQSA